jgi:hypothetical protein
VKLAGIAAVSTFVLGSVAFGQEADTDLPPAGSEAAATPQALPDIGEDQLAVFKLQRGFYLSSDLGVFMTFGGLNGYSNIQPYLSMKAGVDINDFVSIQLSVAHGYSAGNALSEAESTDLGGQGTENYSLTNIGGELVFALRPTPRFALEPRVGGGFSLIYPQLTDPDNPAAVLSDKAPHASFGLDFKYLTLLTDFTAGLSLSGYYVIGPNIPALGAAFVVRYTF